jgi:hypothetical protein
MKTKNLVLTALAVFVATSVSAAKLPTMNVIPVEQEKALVAFEAGTPAAFELSVTNNKGETVYFKKSEKPVANYRMIFDFHDLEDGNYKISLDYNNCKISREVLISDHRCMRVGEEIKCYGPFYKYEDNHLKISYLNQSQKNMHVNIYRDGYFVAGKKLGKDLCIHKMLDLSKLEKGTYEVVLSNRNNEYPFIVQK